MVLTLIGTGRLGTNLHAALCKAGHTVVQLRGRNFSAEQVAGDVVIICVKDAAIQSVASVLDGTDKLVVHTAGSMPMDVLPTSRRGVFYPMQTFSKEHLVEFADIPIFVESNNEEDTHTLETLASTLSQKVYRLTSDERQYLHLAAVFACNFANHCYAIADDILAQHGIPFQVMLPLIDQTASKVHLTPPAQAQTGPAARNDVAVMARQEAMLEGRLKEIYHLFSQSIYDKLRFNPD